MVYIIKEEIISSDFLVGYVPCDMHNFYHLKALNKMKLLNIPKMEWKSFIENTCRNRISAAIYSGGTVG